MLNRAIENCQSYFWSNSAYAVVYCICRDDYKKKLSQIEFEKMVEELPYTKERNNQCTTGTIANAFSNNPIFYEDINEWDSVPCPPVKEECQEEARDTSGDEDSVDDIDCEGKDEGDREDEAERIQREELIGKVMPWFLDQLNQYGEKERNAIKVCAIDFVNEGKFSPPTVVVQNNKLYSHNRIIEICSALYLIGDDNNACVDFIKEVFAEPFANTEESTILKKLSGSDKMLEIIDTYWEAQGIKVEKSRLSPKK